MYTVYCTASHSNPLSCLPYSIRTPNIASVHVHVFPCTSLGSIDIKVSFLWDINVIKESSGQLEICAYRKSVHTQTFENYADRIFRSIIVLVQGIMTQQCLPPHFHIHIHDCTPILGPG